ncbi:MAG: DNA-directed RNA polymerase subunit alpha [Nitrospirota bacterium]
MDLQTKGFQLPDNIVFESDSLTNTYGKFSAEAFERGFGATLGNALRRVMLSSIEGAAVTSIRIPGALHEFTTISGVKEDVVDILLNVKQLRFKSHSDDSQVITVEAKGPGEITGKNIEGSQIEILNPDQHIATLEKKVNVTLELTIAKGRGYVTAESNTDEDQPVDTITVDSIFTPIRKVNFWVEGARVGRSTDYDKLVMEIWTDGSITPQNALSEASNILKEHLGLFGVNGGDESAEEDTAVDTSDNTESSTNSFLADFMDEEPVELNENLLKSVEELELSVRSYNCLKNANIRTLADLVQRTEQEMLRTKNFGRKSLNEIKEIIVAMGLHFNMRIEPEDLEKLAATKRPENAT